MGHDHHFLERLDRVDREHLEYALSLYRDHLAVRWVIDRLGLPRTDRIALAIGDVARGPYIVLAGDGGFVTCLGKGMSTGALEVVPRGKVDDLVRRYKEQRTREQIAEDARREGETEMAFLVRLYERSNEMCRDDIAALSSFASLMARSFFDNTFRMFAQCFSDMGHFAKVSSVKPADRDFARVVHTTWWLAAHGILLAGVGSWDMTDDLVEMTSRQATPTRCIATLGSMAHLTRCAWSAGSWAGTIGAKQSAELVACYEHALHQSRHPLFAIDSIAALGVIAQQHEAHRTGILRFLQSEAGRTDITDSTKLVSSVIESIERPKEAARLALAWGADRYRERGGEGDATEPLATAALLSDDCDVAFHPDEAHVLMRATSVIAGTRLEDFYFERAVARKVCKPWTPNDTLSLITRYPAVGPPTNQPVHALAKPGRNDPCSCGSGRKYKKCCG